MSLVTRLKKIGHIDFVECVWVDDEFPETVEYLKRNSTRKDVAWVELWYREYRDDTDEDSVMIFQGSGDLGEIFWDVNET